jgi:aminomethyltransferase
MTTQIDPAVHQAAKETAIVVDRSNLGMLKISGASRLDLIDRMSTQAVKRLQSGEGRATILTTDIGRTIDRLILYASSDTVYVLTSENHADPIARYLMRYVFFNDDFHLTDVSAETAVFAVYGPQASAKLAAAGFPEGDLPLHHWRQTIVAGVTAYLHRTDPINGDGYFVVCQSADRDALWNHLVGSGLVVANEAAFDFLRIENGRPRFGRELTLDYIPLEAGLWDDISFSKGCYIGQEIIARMESRGKLAKKLTQLRPAAPVAVGSEIEAAGRKVGTVTSVATGPEGTVALGYVRTGMENGRLTVNDIPITLVGE